MQVRAAPDRRQVLRAALRLAAAASNSEHRSSLAAAASNSEHRSSDHRPFRILRSTWHAQRHAQRLRCSSLVRRQIPASLLAAQSQYQRGGARCRRCRCRSCRCHRYRCLRCRCRRCRCRRCRCPRCRAQSRVPGRRLMDLERSLPPRVVRWSTKPSRVVRRMRGRQAMHLRRHRQSMRSVRANRQACSATSMKRRQQTSSSRTALLQRLQMRRP